MCGEKFKELVGKGGENEPDSKPGWERVKKGAFPLFRTTGDREQIRLGMKPTNPNWS